MAESGHEICISTRFNVPCVLSLLMNCQVIFLIFSLPVMVFGEVWEQAPPTAVEFEKSQLTSIYVSEGASVGDINHDGKMDVVAGPRVWLGPSFEESYDYMELRSAVRPKGYTSNFFTFPDRLTDDVWVDILQVGLPGTTAQLAVNPGKFFVAPGEGHTSSCPHCDVQNDICNESPRFLDVIGDEKKELLCFSGGYLILAVPGEDPTEAWRVHRLSGKDPKKFRRYEHGLGVGDLNGDGLKDILERSGWWEQPVGWDGVSTWRYHPYPFAPEKGGAQMFAYDIDGDGEQDVVSALNAHGYGMAWFEQIELNGSIGFKKHIVMTDKPEGNPYGVCFSQPHAMACADIDGDGIEDVVTGKCYFAHNGKDPGAHDPAVLYWFRTVRHPDGSAELVPYQIDDDSGVGRQITAADLNDDGKIDLAVANKKGVFVFIQK
ncbi:MAG: FG-GAP repeat domain-containing protein [Verrucomicrobiales bacterium]